MQQITAEQKPPILLRTQPLIRFTDDDLYRFCQLNKELKDTRQ
ncbi:MAG: hypothetical protein V2I97_14855 [Desulfococcaceae bacterium]|nr:hypothetical protein [Desulfococcaceae bacterium]